jgi:hypothetical protein
VTTLEVLQHHVGGCREWVEGKADNCWAPAEYVLWGKLIPPEGLGPRCYDHAALHVGHDALRPRSMYALIHLLDLARALDEQLTASAPTDAATSSRLGRDA